jgi:multicomponent K+:H+ antiporter subunit D
VLLVATLLVVVMLARAGSALFWRVPEGGDAAAGPLPRRGLAAVGLLLAGIIGLVAWGGAISGYAQATARQLAAPESYAEAVLGPAPAAQDWHRSLR